MAKLWDLFLKQSEVVNITKEQLRQKYLLFKKQLRKQYLFIRYKFNWRHKLIPVKSTDRGFGLSTLIMEDSLRNNIPILLPTLAQKEYFVRQMCLLGDLGFAPPYRDEYIRNNLLIAPSMHLHGRRISKIYVDHSCRMDDVNRVCQYLVCKIENGFVRESEEY